MRMVYKRHKTLQSLARLPEGMEKLLPEPRNMEEANYTYIIERLCALQRDLNAVAEEKCARQASTAATWAHQIKTPIAAMRLQLQNEDTPQSRALLLELGRIEQYVEMQLACQRLNSDSTDYLFRECDLDAIIRTALRRFSGEFTLCIQDTGVGIAPDDLPRIFENGYTGLNGRTDMRASGLGLHLCKRICHNLGHEISAESTPGVGTIIRLDLKQRYMEVE